ncbi:MAG: ABC-2 family transporter protein [Anaerolineales bacterium]|nr:ABC-2 family transporter protein [Anaerolineales bacterium]
MHYLRLTGFFIRASFQEEAAYRANFWISLFYSLLNLGTGVLGVAVLFNQVETLRGWTFAGTLALLGVYLIASALRNLVIGPSLEALAGMDGEVWQGTLDFTLLRPIDIQFLASLRRWRIFSLFDLLLGTGVLVAALAQLEKPITLAQLGIFLLALAAGIAILYAILLAFTALVFWSPGVLFTWIFDSLFQMARYPVGLYPGWLRLVLTWIVPVGMITTVPAEALSGTLTPGSLAAAVALAVALVTGASVFFRLGLRRYASASS